MEVMREALGLSKAIVDMADQIRPPAVPVAPPEPEPPGDDSPVRVIDVGPAKMILNNDDGSTRVWESLIANAPSAFKFMGEQLDAIRKMNMEREARKQQPQQLQPRLLCQGGQHLRGVSGFHHSTFAEISINKDETMMKPIGRPRPPL